MTEEKKINQQKVDTGFRIPDGDYQPSINKHLARLSQEDELKGDSNSIQNQRAILEKYAKDNGFENIEVFVDDGYSGVSFNRPDFQRLLEMMEQGKVATLITKDLSRLGRNYIEVGQYTEMLFPRWDVRYIAINDNYDSLYSEGNELAPFKNLFNEWYARDTSKKIRAVVKAKAERGERVGTVVPYGYRKDPDVKGHLLVNEDTAPVVRLIFSLCAEGKGPKVIANILRAKQILKPTAYRYQTSGKYGATTDKEDIYGWNDRTVAGILDNEIYLGHTINCRTTVVSYKDKRKKDVPESEWYRFENTHEAIVDKVTCDIVRKVRASKRRRTNMREVDKYSGLLFCADCGSKLYFVRGTTIKPEAYNFICSRYRKHMGEELCTPHTIREKALEKTIEDLKASATNVDRFLDIARKYTDMKELTPEILRTFISKIVIHERSRKHVKDAEQDIDIYFTHIGNLNRFCSDGQAIPNQTTA